MKDHEDRLLTTDCVNFLRQLSIKFSGRLKTLLEERKQYHDQHSFDLVTIDGDWVCAKIPEEVKIRTVEITGPASDRKLVINAMNSGADVFMADFEDSMSPTWNNVLQGHINMIDLNNKIISFSGEKEYKLKDNTAILMVRPRGLHMIEKHFFDMPASLFDFGVYFYHNHNKKENIYFYLPKLENSEEAKWWEDVFSFAEESAHIDYRAIRCTVLIETVPALFQADAIISNLEDRIIGLNCGRWDYIFSMIKCFPNNLMSDRSKLTMDQVFLDSYSKYLVKTCHKRGIAAIGGMSAYIPVKDVEKNALALEKVRQDKIRERKNGHDGTWVAHPGLVQLAREAMLNETPVECEKEITKNDLFDLPKFSPTEEGLKTNIDVCMRYLLAWTGGNGCVPINGLMEDMATAEISRSQIKQWALLGIFKKTLIMSLIYDQSEELISEGFNADDVGKIEQLMMDLLFGKSMSFIVDLIYKNLKLW